MADRQGATPSCLDDSVESLSAPHESPTGEFRTLAHKSVVTDQMLLNRIALLRPHHPRTVKVRSHRQVAYALFASFFHNFHNAI